MTIIITMVLHCVGHIGGSPGGTMSSGAQAYVLSRGRRRVQALLADVVISISRRVLAIARLSFAPSYCGKVCTTGHRIAFLGEHACG